MLQSKLEEKATELQFQEAQVKEMKNMNAALENQLTEYMDALEDQNKVHVHVYTLYMYSLSACRDTVLTCNCNRTPITYYTTLTSIHM